MLIYILHSDRFYSFRLPKIVSGNYVLFDYDNKGFKRSLVNIYSENGKWRIKSNNDIQIVSNNQNLESVELNEYNFYQLSVYKTESVLLYVSPACETNYVTKEVVDNSSIVFGSGSDCDVILTIPSISGRQIELTYNNGVWSFKNLATVVPIYINKIKKLEGKISNLDSIFVMGLKIVVCGKNLFISVPFGNINFMGNKLVDSTGILSVQNRVDNNEIYKDFYESSEYFSKSPIFRKKINTLDLTITSPVDKERNIQTSLFMEIVPSALMSLTSVLSGFFSIRNYRNGSADKETLVMSLVMCIVMLFISIIWPFFERIATNLRSFLTEKRRVRLYTKYLKNKRNILAKAKDDQKMTLEFNNVSLEECTNIIKNRTAALYSRNVEQDDFLTIRLGKGKVLLDANIDYSRPDFIQVKDKLLNDIDKLLNEYRYIDDAPFSFSLSKERSIAFIGKITNYEKYMNAILLQLLTFHDYASLKLVVLTSDASPSLQKLKDLNHCWDNEKSIRFFATNIIDAENLSSYLIREYNSRISMSESNDVDNQKKIKTPYYLIVSDNIDDYKNLKIVKDILENQQDVGFGMLMFGSKITDIPDSCTNFVDYDENNATIFKSEMDEKTIHTFVPEFLDEAIDFNYYLRLIGNIPIKLSSEEQGVLPDKLGFLEMYGVGIVEQLNAINRWKNSSVITTLTAPIGVDASGNTLSLDLHEKKHGPHGLIAGMTGSGKSEFIITYILSLAVNYSPSEVQFVLIDYKGGGLAGAFENRKTGIKLPHLVGTITNLDKSSMNRTLVSIQSELQRRQKVFNAAKETLNTGTIDIYKYQKLVREGTIKEPMAHLFIICDEFAELKANQPEFMEQLVSAARIGRSLGIHLILATQKPSGVVDDQIWSNSKFKVCCKVQTSEDSNEMIRRPDAAYIKESGRFFLQVGYDEVFVKGQSAYTGGQYIPTETINVNVNNSIEFIDDVGNVIRTAVGKLKKTEDKVNLGEELGNVLKYLIKCAGEIDFNNQQLWLDNIPDYIYLEDVKKKYSLPIKKGVINPIIGEYDDPTNQKQGYVSIDFTNNGNMYISGVSGCGKTTLLSTIIYSTITTHNTEEVNFYIIDLLSGTLKAFSQAPQVGEFMTIADNDKINKLFYFLDIEIKKRKRYFSDNGGNFSGSVAKGNVEFPNIIVVINGLEVFRDEFDELYSDIFTPLTRDCNRVGISFVITGTSYSSLSTNIESNFPQKIAMKYLDLTEYNMVFSHTNGIVPSSNPGRGLIELDNVYEFQTALICNELYLDRNLTYVIKQLNDYLTPAPTVPVMPKIVSIENIKEEISTLSNVPIGIETSSNCCFNYDFTPFINTIFYANSKMASMFTTSLIRILKETENVKLVVLNVLEELESVEGVKIYNSNFIKVSEALYKNINEKKSDDDSLNKVIFVIAGYKKIQNHLLKERENDENIKTVSDLIMSARDAANFKFILVDSINNSNIDNYEWSDYFDSTNGILIGVDPDDQSVYDLEDSYGSVKVSKDIAIVARNGKRIIIKYVRR